MFIFKDMNFLVLYFNAYKLDISTTVCSKSTIIVVNRYLMFTYNYYYC